MQRQFGLLLILVVLCAFCSALHLGEFESDVWLHDASKKLEDDAKVSFIVSLALRDVDHMHHTLQQMSNPASPAYGQYASLQQLNARYGQTPANRQKVLDFFRGINGAEVRIGEHSDMFEVIAPVSSIHESLKTELGVVTHARKGTEKTSIRALKAMSIPEDLHSMIAFVSLNAPVNHVMPRGAKAMSLRRKVAQKAAGVEAVQESLFAAQEAEVAAGLVSVTGGNEEALAFFKPFCGATATTTNQENPPCASAAAGDQPSIQVAVTQHANIQGDTYLISQEPTVYNVPTSSIYCYNTATHVACSGADGNNCNCIAKIANLPKYTQLRFNVTATYPGSATVQALGQSNLFALTDVATAGFLSTLYNIPKGISVQHGSNQSVAEFYGEFYSNKDLYQFLSLSGLPNASIPVENVYGDLADDQSSPGGEAQLDIEYIMALAPGADTFFYSMSDLNPFDPINEGFLTYLLTVANQTNPPLVHSLSYGDQESNVFNASNPGSIQYGDRCDQEFMMMGLRGLSVLFSSGDDGIGGNLIRDDPVAACQTALPSWPAGSPYVTAVGATMMTDKYLPICGEQYTVSASYPDMPVSNQLDFQCTGTAETVCTSTFGGVITSGGGFSAVSNRDDLAPWQSAAVEKYLSSANAANYPELSYFNSAGRGYPDVATYGSNYFVVLDGKISRESGTSASAPVFAAMVTLWNDMRLAYGMPPMGFIAPFLYYVQAKAPEAFQDITTGNNACGVASSIETANCCEQSFHASAGWDAVTGLGSPNFNVIANLVLNNATAFPNLGAYPVGAYPVDSPANTSAVVDGSDDDDDDSEDEAIRLSALVIACVALALAVVALVVGFCVKKPMASSSN